MYCLHCLLLSFFTRYFGLIINFTKIALQPVPEPPVTAVEANGLVESTTDESKAQGMSLIFA
jgi:hypothetical protein